MTTDEKKEKRRREEDEGRDHGGGEDERQDDEPNRDGKLTFLEKMMAPFFQFVGINNDWDGGWVDER